MMLSPASTRGGILRTLRVHTKSLAKIRIVGQSVLRRGFRLRKPLENSQAEIAGVEIASKKGPVKFEKDEHNRPDTTIQTLSKLKPAFRKDGTITAGNAPGLNTAASAMIVADRAWSETKGIKPIGPPCFLWCGCS